MGKNPQKISTVANTKVYLKDTGYATWTPSTTATTITEASTSDFVDVDCTEYDYLAYLRFHSHAEYEEMVESQARMNDYYHERVGTLSGMWGTLNAITSGNVSNVTTSGQEQGYALFYTNSRGESSMTAAGAYGIYAGGWTTFSEPSISRTKIGFPSVGVRCFSSYFSTDSAAAVNQETSYYEYIVELWRVDASTTVNKAMFNGCRDMWLNGFH